MYIAEKIKLLVQIARVPAVSRMPQLHKDAHYFPLEPLSFHHAYRVGLAATLWSEIL